MTIRRFSRSPGNFSISRAGTPYGTAACVTAPVPYEEFLFLPTRFVVLVIVIICYVGGFLGLLRAGHDPLDIVSVLYLASGVAVDMARRAIGLMRR
ncbi:hypothetical protein [Streptomyces europaeiscabiei]|uniref:hypothetical protein n=1 Tax=Streptomyces europaeiscabiei TaxID=146819 RepID=UPI000765E858|nr:hypothetical protein [Streptomyces europaeiscabiei]MDX3673102.1 hypothetical protein [Streptomyces europaeiscabiei]MDX3716044.1 hypothetical protein [Streptomyces europaeiscabiei]MDX3839456.1 hypothetical protein [Streptomyces europaeiscabiei]MDX3847818.1 hypothetical protein [Streptomyces europaeiscabiei]MDX3867022.1 hypothetical protein [Streptomyces europaeiscabiei]